MAEALRDLTALFKEVKEKKLATWMRKAQKWAVLEWRDRTKGPGVMARFTAAGAEYYGFSARRFLYRQKKHFKPDYFFSGAFMKSLQVRKPRSTNGGSTVSTRFSIFGGALNLIGSMHGLKEETTRRVRMEIHVPSYWRRRPRGAIKAVHVRAYDQMATVKQVHRVESPRTYKDEFALTEKDAAFIAQRTDERFREIFRASALTKAGVLKKSTRAFFRGDDELQETG